jgi:hypothetical protein
VFLKSRFRSDINLDKLQANHGIALCCFTVLTFTQDGFLIIVHTILYLYILLNSIQTKY